MLVGVARRRARSVQERLASTNALAISGKRCEPGFPDAEPFYTYTAPPRIFFGLTTLISNHWHCRSSVGLPCRTELPPL
jgi:hypothetical protein